MLVESFLEYIRYEKNLSTHTVLSYRNDLFQFKKFLETERDGIEMQKVTSDCIREWVALLSEGGMSARSVCRKISSLRAFYRYLVVQSDIQENPVKNIPLPKAHKKIPVRRWFRLLFRSGKWRTVISAVGLSGSQWVFVESLFAR